MKLYNNVVAVVIRTIQFAGRPSCQGSSKVIASATFPSFETCVKERRLVNLKPHA
jgi:hypothetical protein